MFSRKRFCKSDIPQNVRPVLAALSVKGSTSPRCSLPTMSLPSELSDIQRSGNPLAEMSICVEIQPRDDYRFMVAIPAGNLY